jgi:hypothetical protein
MLFTGRRPLSTAFEIMTICIIVSCFRIYVMWVGIGLRSTPPNTVKSLQFQRGKTIVGSGHHMTEIIQMRGKVNNSKGFQWVNICIMHEMIRSLVIVTGCSDKK